MTPFVFTTKNCLENLSLEIQGILDRMKNHFSKCSNRSLQDDVVEIFSNSILDFEESRTTPVPHATGTTSKEIQRSLNNFVWRTSKSEKTQLDEQAARFFFAANIGFQKVEHVDFLKFCELLRPGYKPPCRKILSQSLRNF